MHLKYMFCFQMVDASQSFENVHNTLLTAAKRVISNVSDSVIGTLWTKE